MLNTLKTKEFLSKRNILLRGPGIYNRKLCPGSGSSIYGIEVARAMGLDEEFISQANSYHEQEPPSE